VYRGAPPGGAAPTAAPVPSSSGVCVVALGGTAALVSGAAWELRSCWLEDAAAAPAGLA
jgi:hypothetical protein